MSNTDVQLQPMTRDEVVDAAKYMEAADKLITHEIVLVDSDFRSPYSQKPILFQIFGRYPVPRTLGQLFEIPTEDFVLEFAWIAQNAIARVCGFEIIEYTLADEMNHD